MHSCVHMFVTMRAGGCLPRQAVTEGKGGAGGPEAGALPLIDEHPFKPRATVLTDPTSRRAFLEKAAGFGLAWLIADPMLIRDALAHTVRSRTGAAYVPETLTPEQAADVEAIASRIIPSDDGTPGAREAGVIAFIDRSLAGWAADQREQFEKDLAELNREVRRRWRGTASFAALTPARQDEMLRSIENQPFFQGMLFLTLVGMFGDPSYGGNRDHLGWRLLGQGHEPLYQPPFGWYDAEANRRP